MPVQYVPLVEEEDVIRETTKVTTGLFTGGVGALAGTNLVTKSLSSTQKNYYYNMQYSSEDQLSVTWGHYRGSGSDKHPENDKIVGETEAIYKYFANLVLRDEDADKGLIFSGSTVFEPDIYAVSIERARFKDRVNRKNWTLHLSGSVTIAGSATGTTGEKAAGLKLTDDSNTVAPVATPVKLLPSP